LTAKRIILSIISPFFNVDSPDQKAAPFTFNESYQDEIESSSSLIYRAALQAFNCPD
jgi:hypothetical protein